MLRIGEGPTDGTRGAPEIETTFTTMSTLPHFARVAGGIEGAYTRCEVGANGDEQSQGDTFPSHIESSKGLLEIWMN